MKIHGNNGIRGAIAVLSTVAFAFIAPPAFASGSGSGSGSGDNSGSQDDNSGSQDDHGGQGECAGGSCGTPNNNGGGCGCCCGGSVLVNYTDIGVTYEQSDDTDHDGIDDTLDNCPFTPNPDQADFDGDGIGDVCDNCVHVANKSQKANLCGDIWSKTTSAFSTSAYTENLGTVIGAACDSTCTGSTALGAPETVSLTPGTGTVTTPDTNVAKSSSSGCAVTGKDADGPAGLMFLGLGVVGLSVMRRRRAA
jgi:MYXO-CTERM domain-containing protein